jgi:hypothetical protein
MILKIRCVQDLSDVFKNCQMVAGSVQGKFGGQSKPISLGLLARFVEAGHFFDINPCVQERPRSFLRIAKLSEILKRCAKESLPWILQLQTPGEGHRDLIWLK